MNLVPLSTLFEGARKRRTAYRSGRRELIGFESNKPSIRPKRKSPKKNHGRLIARTPFASKHRWRVY